jgi:hypothetical protein
LEEDGLQLVVVIVRLIWLRRNKVVFCGDFQSPSTLYRLAKEQVEHFSRADEGRHFCHPQQTNPPMVQRWIKPPFGVVKFNWDVVVGKEGRRMGIGIIFHDHNKLILAAYMALRQYITNPTTAEKLWLPGKWQNYV